MEEEKKEEEAPKTETQESKKKSNLIKFIIAIIAIVCVLVVVLVIIGNKNKDTEKDDDDESDTIKIKSSYLVDDAKERGTKRYWADVSSAMFSPDDYDDDDYMKALSKLTKAEINFYVNDNQVVEIVIAMDFTDFCKKMVKDYPDKMEDLDLDDLEDAEDYFTGAMRKSFSSDSGKSYTDGGKVFYAVSEADDIEDIFGNDDEYDAENFESFREAFEDEMDVKLKKIN